MIKSRRILYLVSEDWYFCSHRLPIARAARDAGAKVFVATKVTNQRDKIENEGFQLLPLIINRSGINPLSDIATLWSLIRLYRKERPDIVHHVAMKPVIYGSLAAWITGVPIVINALAGLGFLFVSNKFLPSILQLIVKSVFLVLFNRKNFRLILQNPDDVTLFRDKIGVKEEQITMIRGSGVNVILYKPTPEPEVTPDHPVVALCVARLLWDKGIGELVEAARLLKSRDVAIKIRLVGPLDKNPAAINKFQLDAWKQEGIIEIAGYSEDIRGEYACSHIAVLPSYREGLPKSLLEAAASGKPIIASDVPGCREICREGETGLLVPARCGEKLAEALTWLADNRELRQKMGAAARKVVEQEFSTELVTERTLALYEEVLRKKFPSAKVP